MRIKTPNQIDSYTLHTASLIPSFLLILYRYTYDIAIFVYSPYDGVVIGLFVSGAPPSNGLIAGWALVPAVYE